MSGSVSDTERFRYMWNRGYDCRDEYDKNPRWTKSIRVEEDELGDTFTAPSLRFYDRYDPEHIWIRSDDVKNLNKMI